MGTVDERQRRRRPASESNRAGRNEGQRRRPPASDGAHRTSGQTRQTSSGARRTSGNAQHTRRESDGRDRQRRSQPKKKKKFTVGRIMALIELLVSFIFFGLVWKLGVLPGKYMMIIAVVLLVLFLICFGMQFGRKRMKITGMVFSLLFIILFSIGSYYISKMDSTMGKVGGATYKTDNMIVAVRAEDGAQKLEDAKGYTFGYQTLLDTDNTETMVNEVNKELGIEIDTKAYESPEAMGQALMDMEVDAIIYNEALNGMIGETVEEYESKIRVIYQHGIKTEMEVKEKSVKEPFSVFISGIDVYGAISTNSRSDVNIIMTVNPETKQILLTSTPRDYYVPIPGISGGRRDKLTHAGIYGVDRSMATLEELYGIDIGYYARVNFSSLIQIIDVLGGVDVNSEVSFSAQGYSFNTGMNHMNGKKALAFARERHSFAAGDNQRGKNQQAVITGILNKAMSPAILTNAGALMSSLGDSVQTNMTQEELSELIRMQLADGAAWNIQNANAVGAGDKQSCFSSGAQLLYVMQPDMNSVSEIKTKMDQVINGEVIQ